MLSHITPRGYFGPTRAGRNIVGNITPCNLTGAR